MPDPDDKKKEEEEKKEDEVTMKQLVQAVKFLGNRVVQSENRFKTIEEQMVLASARGPKVTDLPKDKVEPEAVDLEELDNTGLATHITNSVVTEVKKLMGPVQSRIAAGEDKNERRAIQVDLERAADKYDDFWGWKDEMKTVMDKHPGLSIDEAFTLARKTNDAKADAIDKKAAEKAAAEEKVKAAAAEQEYGGLLPTSGRTVRSEAMSSDDAAEAAFTEIIEGTPHEKMLAN